MFAVFLRFRELILAFTQTDGLKLLNIFLANGIPRKVQHFEILVFNNSCWDP